VWHKFWPSWQKMHGMHPYQKIWFNDLRVRVYTLLFFQHLTLLMSVVYCFRLTNSCYRVCKELHGQPDPLVQQKIGHNFQSHFSILQYQSNSFFSWAIQRVRAAVIVAVVTHIWKHLTFGLHTIVRGGYECSVCAI